MKHRVDVSERDDPPAIADRDARGAARAAPCRCASSSGNQAVVRHLSRARTLARFVDDAAAQDVIAALATATTAQLRAIVAALDAPPVGDTVGVDLPDRSLTSTWPTRPSCARAMDRLRQALMSDLASGRQPLFLAMHGCRGRGHAAHEHGRAARVRRAAAGRHPALRDLPRDALPAPGRDASGRRAGRDPARGDRQRRGRPRRPRGGARARPGGPRAWPRASTGAGSSRWRTTCSPTWTQTSSAASSTSPTSSTTSPTATRSASASTRG